MSKFKVTPLNGDENASFEVEADRMVHSEITGRTLLFLGEELVASYVNVNAHKLAD